MTDKFGDWIVIPALAQEMKVDNPHIIFDDVYFNAKTGEQLREDAVAKLEVAIICEELSLEVQDLYYEQGKDKFLDWLAGDEKGQGLYQQTCSEVEKIVEVKARQEAANHKVDALSHSLGKKGRAFTR